MNNRLVEPFRDSPFSLMADEAAAQSWAGRDKVLAQLRKLCRSWANLNDSTLDLMWANLGAGKTHALLHLKYMLANDPKHKNAIPIFIELPEHVSKFLEVYRLIAAKLPFEKLAEFANRNTAVDVRIRRACRAISQGDHNEKQLAMDWLNAGRPALRDLRSITGIDSRIEQDADAEHVLADVLKLFAENAVRVVLLVDEFQRIGRLPQKSREALLAHVRGLFSRTPRNMSVVLAIGTRVEKTAIELLPPELKTIIGMRAAISLPEMSVPEAKDFLGKRFLFYRPSGYAGDLFYPFTESTIDRVLNYLVDNGRARLIPRTVLQVFGILYNEVLIGTGGKYSDEDVDVSLEGLRWEAAD
jgi:hypothetical protein